MTLRKVMSNSRSENYTDTPSTITIRPPNGQQTREPLVQHDRKITQILLKNRLHLSSIRDDDETIRMLLFATMYKLLNKQVPGLEKLKKLLCDNLNTSSLDGLTEIECKNRVAQLLDESIGLPPVTIEKQLLQLFNSQRSYDRYLVGTIRKKIQKTEPVRDAKEWLEMETSVKIDIRDINDPLREKADLLISREGRIFKRSVREQQGESEGGSLFSQPKEQEEVMELTLSKISDTRMEKQPQEIVVTEFKAQPQQKSKSFWDIICCSE